MNENCPRCGSTVTKRKADEMPTLVNEQESTRTTFYVVFCKNHHILRYEDVTESIENLQ
jgi:hypothetical protein